MPLDELRARVVEAEKLLRVARRLAQDELRNPAKSEHAKNRIASLCAEVSSLFPGLGVVDRCNEDFDIDDEDEDADDAGSEGVELSEDADEVHGDDDVADEDEDDSDAEDEDEDEWTIDYEKLRVAIQDPTLMGHFPEGERAQFKAMAEELLDAHDRQELYARVSAGFAELEETTRAGAEEIGRHLALVLTLEELRAKNRA
jgi:hypothetical protein